ncbi:GNAT superfamily N-acetyltransferase [Inhella inkyongensis]|uniref:GNAT superfamily N-acetyltransferase n=1 Tax=Inhella inkyongensis TaxID=392593 RepID=A0A840S7S0_9BURK|nr:GNAT family N-acetyltransferase [Inhella inkyongensis]MBB5204834.1 GNAT superfamily N-acetyltransferase [Inhella inkyongensis]
MQALHITPLGQRLDLLPLLQSWFEAEWPGHYGPDGRGDAAADLRAYAREGALPLGLVALRDGHPCGFAAIKTEPFASHPTLGPWAGAAVVPAALRRQGIGRALLLGLEAQARSLRLPRLFCATATSASLLERCGWQRIDSNASMAIFVKVIGPAS